MTLRSFLGRRRATCSQGGCPSGGRRLLHRGSRHPEGTEPGARPRCTVTVATEPFDLVVEGEAARVTDDTELQRVAAAYAEGGWPASARDGALDAEYSAPSAGPPPWHAYRLTPTTIYAFGTAEPYGATRWRF